MPRPPQRVRGANAVSEPHSPRRSQRSCPPFPSRRNHVLGTEAHAARQTVRASRVSLPSLGPLAQWQSRGLLTLVSQVRSLHGPPANAQVRCEGSAPLSHIGSSTSVPPRGPAPAPLSHRLR